MEGRQADLLGLQGDQSEGGVVVDHHLDRQLMMHGGHELTHQHVEAAVAGKGDHLARAVQRLHPVGLAEGGADRRVVERADDPLAAARAHPVGGPQGVEAGVEHEHGVGMGQIPDHPRHGLRMDLVLAARRIGLAVEHLVPVGPLAHGGVEMARVALGLDQLEQPAQGGPRRADGRAGGGRAAAQHLGPLVDLRHLAAVRQELRVRIISADHQQEVAALGRQVGRPRADHADAAEAARVVVGQDVLALH